MYKSPEVEWRGLLISKPIDMWALGVVAIVMAGVPFTEVPDNLSLPQRSKIYLGDPPAPPGCSSPGGVALVPGIEWPAQLFTAMGRIGIELLEQLLTYDPRKRMTVAELLEHEYVLDGIFPLVGVTSSELMRDDTGAPDETGLEDSDLMLSTFMIHGSSPGWENIFPGHPLRHNWSLRLWSIRREILLWMQKDSMFITGTPANDLVLHLAKGKEKTFSKLAPKRCHVSLGGKKVRIGGHLCKKGTLMITLEIDEACPLARAIDFMKAFLKVNRQWLLAM